MFGEAGHTSLNYGKAIVAGWGYTYNYTADDSISIVATPKLQKLEVNVTSIQECIRRYKNLGADLSEFISVETNLCAGGDRGRDSCTVSKNIFFNSLLITVKGS